jgi:hypothetical protein
MARPTPPTVAVALAPVPGRLRHYCTYFDHRYAARGLTLYRSLQEQATPFKLWALCLDDVTFNMLSARETDSLHPIRLRDLESFDPQLAASRSTRSLVEYYFTMTPCWLRFILHRSPEVEALTYLDADLYFFTSPEPIFAEMGDQSILIVGHRFPDHLKHYERNGIFNVGLLTFRRDRFALACLEWWRERCLEWCYDRNEDGRYADQGYLNDWPTRFEGVHVLAHAGCGLAPWNIGSQRLSKREGLPHTADGVPVVFYHFHGLRVWNRWIIDPGWQYEATTPAAVRSLIYAPYVRELRRTLRALSEWLAPFDSLEDWRGPRYHRRKIFKMVLLRKLIFSLGPLLL